MVQLLYGQEKYIIQGEFPDNSLDGKYIILTDKSFLPDEYKRKWKASDDEVKILVTDKNSIMKGQPHENLFWRKYITIDQHSVVRQVRLLL